MFWLAEHSSIGLEQIQELPVPSWTAWVDSEPMGCMGHHMAGRGQDID